MAGDNVMFFCWNLWGTWGDGGGGGTCVYVGLAGYAKLETVISAARCVGLKLIV